MASRIASARASEEGRRRRARILEKRKPAWIRQAMKKGAKMKK